MGLENTLESVIQEFEVPVKATLGYITDIRVERGFYEAKVALLNVPPWWRSRSAYMLGQERDPQTGAFKQGAWIQFGDSAEYLVSQWQPRKGDRVLVLTFGDYDYENGRIYRLSTSDEINAKQAGDMVINGPLRVLSGGMT